MNKQKSFTLIELVIVIAILWILLIIGTTFYQKWLANSRDTKRLADLDNIESSLNIDAFSANKRLIPDDYINITLSGTKIAYQWYFGSWLQKKLEMTKILKDPLDKTYYTYYTNSNKTKYQLLGFLENKRNIVWKENSTLYKVEKDDRFPIIRWDNLGVLINYDSYKPIQEIATGSFDIANTTNNTIFYINQNISFDGIGEVLINAFATITKEDKYIKTDDNLIWLFDFDNIVGTGANDYSKYWHNGSITGASIINAKLGSWLEFDWIDDMFQLNTDLNQWLGKSGTITAWIKTTQVGNNIAREAPGITWAESAWDGDDIFWWRIDASGRIRMMAGNNAGAKSNFPINDGKWYHVWLSRDYISGETKVYINGVLQDTDISETGIKGTPFRSFWVIRDDGDINGNDDDYFQWDIDQIAVYKRVLSDKEIKLIYDYSLKSKNWLNE